MKQIMFRKKGQGLTEYILIIALIALAAIVSIQVFGEKIKAKFTALSDTLSS